jgi:hypothetical protein
MSSIFISYSHADAKQQADLRRFLDPLERKGLIEFWDDTKIQTGDDWKQEIDQALAASRTAVLLVTQNFLKSPFISDEELPYLLAKHKNKEITILPVFLGVSNVGLAQPELSAIQGYGSPSQPLSNLKKVEREKIYVEISERLAKLAQQQHPPTPLFKPSLSPPLDSRNYALTVNLRREGAKLMIDYRRPGEDPFLRSECAWAGVETNIRPMLNILRSGEPNRIAGLAATAADHWGGILFQLLFREKHLETIFRTAFYHFDPGVMPNPVHAPLRVCVVSDDPELAVLPWRITAWDGHLLRDRRWVFASGQNPDPANDVSTLAPCEVLLIAESGHGQMLRESLLTLWPKAADSVRLATSGGQVENAILGQSPHLVYVHAEGNQGLRLADGVLPLPKLAEWLNAQRPGPAVVMLYLDDCGLTDPRALFGRSIPLLLWRTMTFPMQNPTALPLAWLNAWLGEGRDPVEALQQICREGSPVDAVEAQTLAVRADYRHWRTDPPKDGPRNPATLHRLDREKQKGVVAKWLGELIASDRMRVLALTPYGGPGNRLMDLHEQLGEYAKKELDRRAAIKLTRLQFPESRANLRMDLEHELKQQLGLDEAGGESVRHLLQRVSPRYDADRRSVLWLHWGVFGGADHETPLKSAELSDWLNFTCEFLTQHCPDNIRIVSSVSIETAVGNHPKLHGFLTQKHRELAAPGFWLRILEPLDKVAEYELLDYLKDHADGCPPQLCAKLAELLILGTGGEFERLLKLIEPAEKAGSWHALSDSLLRKYKPITNDDNLTFD